MAQATDAFLAAKADAGRLTNAMVKSAYEEILDNYPNPAWRAIQWDMLARVMLPCLWTPPATTIRACLTGDINTPLGNYDGYSVRPNDVIKNIVVQLIALNTGVYDECKQFRVPGSNGDASIFSDPTQWWDNLNVVVIHAQEKSFRNRTIAIHHQP